MPKLFSIIALSFLSIGASAFASDQESLTDLANSTVRIQFHSTVIPASAIILELGKVTLSSGNSLGCSLQFNAHPSNRFLNGEFKIEDATVGVQWDGRYHFYFFGDYSFNGRKNEYFDMRCYDSSGNITIGDFREYLKAINGSITMP